MTHNQYDVSGVCRFCPRCGKRCCGANIKNLNCRCNCNVARRNVPIPHAQPNQEQTFVAPLPVRLQRPVAPPRPQAHGYLAAQDPGETSPSAIQQQPPAPEPVPVFDTVREIIAPVTFDAPDELMPEQTKIVLAPPVIEEPAQECEVRDVPDQMADDIECGPCGECGVLAAEGVLEDISLGGRDSQADCILNSLPESESSCRPDKRGLFGRGLLHYRKWWESVESDISAGGDLLRGIPIYTDENTLRVTNDKYSYFIPLEKIDYIRTPDGYSSCDLILSGK